MKGRQKLGGTERDRFDEFRNASLVLCPVFRLIVVLFCVMYVICLLCLSV
jgi:hypothetical protein